ncbi:MAG: N-6 DNA methylase [Deltaproteobacteria bacterium]|nr:N-6 DNA methylase [Deltaproteobacteria bacterium]MBW2166899.1 N-6 DNA methylase [Deltaproteobacteria bacterium]
MTQNNNGANLGFENKLWEMADKMRGHMDAGEYKHVVLGRFAAAEGKGGIDADLGRHHADSFHNDLHKDLKADFILANPPFNMSDWGGQRLKEDVRWKYGVPPVNNANYAWISHFIHYLAPTGIVGFVMANGSMATNTSSEGEIRKKIIESDLVDCMIALPGQLFYTTPIPVCLWFVTRSKKAGKRKGLRDRKGDMLFIDARKMGTLVDRVHRELTNDDLDLISDTYHEWRNTGGKYEDKADQLEAVIRKNLEVLGYGK